MESRDLIVSSKMLRDAKAGNYVPTSIGRFKSHIYPYSTIEDTRTLLDDYPTLLDISFYQVTANFDAMVDNGIDGVIIRAGQNGWEDSKAVTFMKSAELAKMPIGSYWFYDSRAIKDNSGTLSSPKTQAKLWSDILYGYDTKFMCWADYEENYNGVNAGWRKFYDFLEWCKFYMPERKFGIYTGYYYWLEHSPNPMTEAGSLDYFKQYPLWLAWYTTNIANVRIPKPWNKMTFWQFTSSGDGAKYGVGSKEVDMNKFIGTREEFKTMFNLEGNGDTMPEVNWKGNILSWVSTARVRSTPNGEDTGLRITGGSTVEATGEPVQAGVYSWRNLVSPYQGWVADHLMEGSYISQPATLPDTLYIGTKPDGSDLEKYIKDV